jgi:hypothetical protein
LTAAKWLAGDDDAGGLFTPYTSFGYSLTLVPAYLLGSEPSRFYRLALLTNALVFAVSIAPLYLLARRALLLSRESSLLAAAITALYPPTVLQAGLVWTESLFPVLWCSLLLAALGAWRRPTLLRVGGLALSAAGLLAVHPRALIVLPILAIAAATLARRRPSVRPVLAAGTLILLLALWAVARVNGLLHAAVWDPAARAIELSGRLPFWLERLAHPTTLAVAALGHAWYLFAASLGLGFVGGFQLAAILRRQAPGSRLLAGLALAAGGAVAVASVVALGNLPGTRLDLPIYGRHVEAFVHPVLLAGVATVLCRLQPARHLHRIAALAAAAGLALVLVYGEATAKGRYAPHVVHGVLPYGYQFETLFPAWAALASVLLAALVGWLASRSRSCTAVALAGLALFAVWRVQRLLYYPLDLENRRTYLLDDVIVASELAGAPLAYDLTHRDEAAMNAYLFGLGRQRFLTYRSAREAPPADLVISGRASAPRRGPLSATLLAVEASRNQALWAFPGPLLDGVRERGVAVLLEAEGLYSSWQAPWRLTRRRRGASGGAVRSAPDRLDPPPAGDFLTRGPASVALPGRYRLEVRGHAHPSGAPPVEVWTRDRPLVATRLHHAAPSGSAVPPLVTLELEIDSELSGLEVGVRHQRGRLEVDAIEIRRFLPPVPAARTPTAGGP